MNPVFSEWITNRLSVHFIAQLTSSCDLHEIICANHCCLSSCFLAVQPNDPSSGNTPHIATQLEHIAVTVCVVFHLYCEAVKTRDGGTQLTACDAYVRRNHNTERGDKLCRTYLTECWFFDWWRATPKTIIHHIDHNQRTDTHTSRLTSSGWEAEVFQVLSAPTRTTFCSYWWRWRCAHYFHTGWAGQPQSISGHIPCCNRTPAGKKNNKKPKARLFHWNVSFLGIFRVENFRWEIDGNTW